MDLVWKYFEKFEAFNNELLKNILIFYFFCLIFLSLRFWTLKNILLAALTPKTNFNGWLFRAKLFKFQWMGSEQEKSKFFNEIVSTNTIWTLKKRILYKLFTFFQIHANLIENLPILFPNNKRKPTIELLIQILQKL